YWAEPLAKMTPATIERIRKNFENDASNMMKLRAAGMRVVMGTDTGQSRFLIGYYNHAVIESYVGMGMTPGEAIVASTRDSAEIAKVNSGMVAPGRSADFIVLMPIRWRTSPTRARSTRSICAAPRYRAA